MRLGYGVRVKEVKGREYVDAWRYDTRNGTRVQLFEYVGPLEDPGTERKLVRRQNLRVPGATGRRLVLLTHAGVG